MGIHPYSEVPDPDLEIGAWGGGGGRSPKKIFLALQASVWSKNKGGAESLPSIRHCSGTTNRIASGARGMTSP